MRLRQALRRELRHGLRHGLVQGLRRVRGRIAPRMAAAGGGADGGTVGYWTRHNVTAHHRFASAADSLAYLEWRNDQYFDYIRLMPLDGQDGKVVLDYGCGPGHDLVGFGAWSRPARLIGMDVSASSLAEAKARLALHASPAELIQLDTASGRLPLPDASVDHVHTSGVLHHVPDIGQVLGELRRVLRPGGTMNVMVYNYDSLWMHLYVAWRKRIVEGRFAALDLRAAFARTTDGEDCPIANVYRPAEFVALAAAAGLPLEFSGAAISMFEASLAPSRFEAVQDRRLPAESRRFLLGLELDRHGLPTWRGHYAGVDGCYRLGPRP
jgi:SAM-dependent methyltransferase